MEGFLQEICLLYKIQKCSHSEWLALSESKRLPISENILEVDESVTAILACMMHG